MNEVSIIINGVRYDAVEAPKEVDFSCENCELRDYCNEMGKATYGHVYALCALGIGDNKHFKKSDKKFER